MASRYRSKVMGGGGSCDPRAECNTPKLLNAAEENPGAEHRAIRSHEEVSTQSCILGLFIMWGRLVCFLFSKEDGIRKAEGSTSGKTRAVPDWLMYRTETLGGESVSCSDLPPSLPLHLHALAPS
ncbi:uncharacterized [Tachysurus ichikawai]